MRFLFLLLFPVLALGQAGSPFDPTFVAVHSFTNTVFTPESAEFDIGVYMERGGGLTGAADSKTGILSFWYKANTDDDDERVLFVGNYPAGGFAQTGVRIYRYLDQSIFIDLYDSSGTQLMGMEATGFNVGNGWRHVMCAWDLATTTCNIYVNGSPQGPAHTISDGTIDYTQTQWVVGDETDHNNPTLACVSEFYLNFGEFIDLTDSGNRAKFYDAGSPVDLGADGSTPTGTAPEVYLREWTGVNAGSGGNFTLSSEMTPCDTPEVP